jgi:hypothetical protein
MNMKPLILAMSLVGVFASAGAQAADYNFGDVTNTSVSPADATENGGLGFFTVTGDFVDNLFFSVSQSVIGSGQVFEFQYAPFSNIDIMSVGLYSESPTPGFPLMFLDVTSNSPAGLGSAFVGRGPLSAGNYYFQISGTATIDSSRYLFSAATVPVPEPETWAMLVAGLGLVGLQLRRRTNTGKIAIN